MKRLLLLMMCLPIVCLGQGVRYDSHVITSATNVPYGAQAAIYTIPFSSVYICASPASGNPCTNTVNVYSDQALTQTMDQPLQSDEQGRFGFWLSAGQYTYSIVSPAGKFLGTYNLTLASSTGGGGSPPAGATYEMQSNLNGTAFGGSGFFTNTDHSSLYTPASQWGQYSVNSPKSGYCGSLQCAQIGLYGQDSPLLNGSGQATGYGNAFFQYRRNLFTALSAFDGYGSYGSYDPPGGSVIKMQSDTSVFHSPSISQNLSIDTYAGKDGDASGVYSYIHCHGGYRWGGDEGCTNIRANGGLDYQTQGAFQLTGSPGKGATTLTSNLLYGPDNIFVSGFVYDFNGTPIASGNITGYDSNNHLLTVTAGSVTPATNEGSSTTAITISTAEQNAVVGVSKTITVHMSLGTGFVIDNTSPVVLACPNPDLEIVVPTAVGAVDGSGNQMITANFYHGHPSGCTVAQGGTVGVLDLVADRIPNNWKTSYFVFGAPDNSHIYEVTYITGDRGSINPWKHNFGPGYDSHNAVAAQITGDGTTITACNLGQGAGNFSGQYVQITGASPSTFNGTYTASALDKNLCVSMAGTGSGTATGATLSVGGAINSPDGTIQGGGGFKIWQTARIKQIGVTTTTSNGIKTNAYNNTFTMYPNDFTAVSGHTLIVLDDMQSKVEPLAALGSYDVAPGPNVNNWLTAQAKGYGITTTAFRMISAINQNPLNWYKGGGATGQLEAPRGVSIEGPYTQGVYMQAPVQGGYGLYIDRNPNSTNANLNNSFFPIFVLGSGGGGGGFTVNFDPNLGRTIIASGTGDGVFTSIMMDPNNFTLAAGLTGTFTLQGQTYNFNGLTGASTSCASLGSTGNLGRSCPVFGASGASHSAGQVPDPGSTSGTTKFLREDGTWQLPTAGFTGTCASTTTVTVANGIITGCS